MKIKVLNRSFARLGFKYKVERSRWQEDDFEVIYYKEDRQYRENGHTLLRFDNLSQLMVCEFVNSEGETKPSFIRKEWVPLIEKQMRVLKWGKF